MKRRKGGREDRSEGGENRTCEKGGKLVKRKEEKRRRSEVRGEVEETRRVG